VIWFVIAAGIAAGLPLALQGEYARGLATAIAINAIVVLGLNLLMGYAGQVSLGQAAFVGIGAYTSAVLTTRLHVNPWLGLLAAVGLSSLVAMAVGSPLLKLKGHYLAMGTLGLGVIAYIVMVQWDSLTNGTTGISSIPPLAIGSFEFSGARMYYPAAGFLLLTLLAASNIIASRVGRAMRAVHGSEVAAETAGVDTSRYKLQVFVLSGAFAGLAGSLYAHDATYVVCDTFGFHYSIQLVVMTVLGGMASIWGAPFGAAAVVLIAENLRSYQEYSSILFGGVLVVTMAFLPSGIWRGAVQAARRVAGLARRPAATQGEAADG
jgi:branched-chain amino acid transport system permease protein